MTNGYVSRQLFAINQICHFVFSRSLQVAKRFVIGVSSKYLYSETGQNHLWNSFLKVKVSEVDYIVCVYHKVYDFE